MNRSKKVLIVILALGLVGFGYSQYAFASQIDVSVTQSELIKGIDSQYSIQLQFDNPSLLYLTAGETEFIIYADGKKMGYGTLDPFVLPALDTSTAHGTFEVGRDVQYSDVSSLKISGTTQYDVILTKIDVPFVFYPTQEQTREFIHNG